jgi:hypothetical protein
MSELTYGRMDNMLRSLGFTVHLLKENTRGCRHANSGARITLPNFPDKEKVYPHHLIAVRAILDGFGIPEPQEFASAVPKAS